MLVPALNNVYNELQKKKIQNLGGLLFLLLDPETNLHLATVSQWLKKKLEDLPH